MFENLFRESGLLETFKVYAVKGESLSTWDVILEGLEHLAVRGKTENQLIVSVGRKNMQYLRNLSAVPHPPVLLWLYAIIFDPIPDN